MATVTIQDPNEVGIPFAISEISYSQVVSSSSTAVTLTVPFSGGGVGFVLGGTFSDFQNNYPSSGTLTSLTQTYAPVYGVSMTITGFSLAVSTFNTLVANHDETGLFSAMLGGADTLTGAGGGDVLKGFAGADLIYGMGGADSLFGGEGGDQLFGGEGGDFLNGGGGDDLLDGGAGLDVASYSEALAAVTVDLRISGAQASGEGSDTLISIEGLRGSNFDDVLYGDAGSNYLNGGAGSDKLWGFAGDDLLISGGSTGAADELHGGTGDDVYQVYQQGDLAFEEAGEGTDTVIAGAGYYLWPNLENLILASGWGNIFGVGNELNNVITGNEGDNLLIGWDGADTLNGGAGNDALFGVVGDDILNGDAGIDYLVGGDGADILDGGDNPDSLYGEAGADILIGGVGFFTDIMVGGDGDDILHGDSGLGDYDLMDGGAGADTYYVDTPDDLTFEAEGGGTDTVIAGINGAGYYLYANTENLVLTGATPFGVGNELNNVLTGSALANWLLGGAGNDTLNGKGGNDVLFGEAGSDTFVFERGTGGDVIGDFQVGVDKIRIDGVYGSFAELQSHMVDNGGTTAIDLGSGDMVVVVGVAMSSLGAGDFVLG